MEIVFHDEREFEKWLLVIGPIASAKVAAKLVLLRAVDGAAAGMPLVRALGGHLYELRVHGGAGYRVYFAQSETTIRVLAVGTKGTQARDIARARGRMT